MKKKIKSISLILIIFMLFSVKIFAQDSTTASPIVEGASSAEIIAEIIICVLFGIILSFYIIYKMKNKH